MDTAQDLFPSSVRFFNAAYKQKKQAVHNNRNPFSAHNLSSALGAPVEASCIRLKWRCSAGMSADGGK